MNPTTLRLAAASLVAALLLCACGGGNKGNNGNNGNTTNTGNTMSSGTRVKQFNPLHNAHNAISGHLLNINMGALNGSKQDGAASAGDKNGGLQVSIHVYNEPKGASEPAHIHKGTCKNIDPAPWKSLNNVVNGSSMTNISGVSVAELKKGHYAINVHKSLNDLKTYVSCGDLTP